MTERERLIELLHGFTATCSKVGNSFEDDFCSGCKYEKYYTDARGCEDAQLADYLLANGVIVPPVILGQTVYTIQGQRKYPKEWTVVGIWKSEECCRFHALCYIDGKLEASSSFEDYMIGKTVYLTKEEAEEALKERNKK